jgi:hypothetical protein
VDEPRDHPQLIEQDLDTSQLHAVSDRRKGGVPAGYVTNLNHGKITDVVSWDN